MENKLNIEKNLTKAITFRNPDAKVYLKGNSFLSADEAFYANLIHSVNSDNLFNENEQLFNKISYLEHQSNVFIEVGKIVADIHNYFIQNKGTNVLTGD